MKHFCRDIWATLVLKKKRLIYFIILGLLFLTLIECGIFVVLHPKTQGLLGVYYDNTTWQGKPFTTSVDTDISTHTLKFQRAKLPRNRFSVEWTGYINIPETGTYTFFTNSDDGSWIFIDDTLAVDNGGAHGLRKAQGKIYLTKGLHGIRIRYFQIGGYLRFEVSWAKDQYPKTSLTKKSLFPPYINVRYFQIYCFAKRFLPFLITLGCLLIIGLGISKYNISLRSHKMRKILHSEVTFGVVVIGTLLLLYYLVFVREFFSREYLLPGEQWSLHYLTLFSLKHFHSFPWWNPALYNGYPLYYFFLSGVINYLNPFYLPSFILFKVLSLFTDVNINTYIVFQRTLYITLLNMIAIYLIAREIVIKKIAAILPVLLFSFSYFQILNFHDSHAFEAMIAPLFYIFALIRYTNKRTFRNLGLLFLFLGLLLASLNYMFVASAIFWSGLFTFFLLLFNISLIKDTYHLLLQFLKTKKGILILVLALCLLLSGSLASLSSPYYNTGYVLRYRGGEKFEYESTGRITDHPIPIEKSQIWTIFFNWIPFPEIHDKLLDFAWHDHDNRYIGLVTLPLIIAALILGMKNRYPYILFLTYFLCNGYIIYTTDNIVYDILLDNSDLFRNVRNMLTLFPRGGPPLFLIFLAGIGLDILLKASHKNEIVCKEKPLLKYLFIISSILIGIVGLLLLISIILLAILFETNKVWMYHTLAHTGIYLIIFSFLCMMIYIFDKQTIKKRLIIVLFIFTFTDLTIAASHHIDMVAEEDPFTAEYPAVLAYYGRIPYEEFAKRDMVIPDNTAFKPVYSDSDDMFPENYVGLHHHTWEIKWGTKEWLVLATKDEGQKFLSNWNPERLRMIKYPEFQFFTNGYYVPLGKIKEIDKDQSIVEHSPLFLLHDDQLVFSKKVATQEMEGVYQIQEYTPNKVVIKTITHQDGFLLSLDNYDRFWSAFIDSKEVKIHRANFTFKAIELPAGEHVVSWVYNPYPVKMAYGMFYLLLVGFLVIFLFVDFGNETDKRKQSCEDEISDERDCPNTKEPSKG